MYGTTFKTVAILTDEKSFLDMRLFFINSIAKAFCTNGLHLDFTFVVKLLLNIYCIGQPFTECLSNTHSHWHRFILTSILYSNTGLSVVCRFYTNG